MAKFTSFIVLAGLLIVASGKPQTRPEVPPPGNSSTTARPTDPSSPRPSIILGTPAEDGEIPFQALLFSSTNGSDFGFNCGGSLIHPSWILTAAHCLPETDGSQVNMGSVRRDSMTYSEWSYQRYPHEGYNPSTLENDIALVRLPRPASGPNIATVEMAPESFGSLEGETTRASGFGLTSNDGQVSDVLLKVNLVVSNLQECDAAYGNPIDERQICTVYSTREGESTCEGDSGGPLSYDDQSGTTFLVGLTSFGSPAGCDANVPSAYTRVSSFRNWIAQTMAANE